MAAPAAVGGSVDHRVALSHPALMRAPSQQSCSSASGPLLAWRTLRSGASTVAFVVPPHTSTARVSNGCVHAVIWVGCPPNCVANSARVFSPLTAANATGVLKAAP